MHSFETPGRVSLHVRLPSGRVTVTTVDEPRTEVEIVPVGRRGPEAAEDVLVSADERSGRHRITVEQEDRFRWGPIRISLGSVEVRVTCPRGTDVELSGGSTDLRADGVLGDVRARTATGDVRLETVSGELEIKTASGDVEVHEVAAGAAIVTVSGDLAVDRLAGAANARTVSGDVEIGSVRDPLVLATTSGDVELRSVAGGEVRLQTISGDVRIGVARGTRVWVDAASVSGNLDSELGLSDAPASSSGDADADSRDAQVVPLHVKTVSGDVAIVRAAETLSV